MSSKSIPEWEQKILEKRKKWKIRIIKSDLPELKERIQFLGGSSWDVSVGVDGVEGVDNTDGRLVVNKIPASWSAETVLQWLKQRIDKRKLVTKQMKEEIGHLEFVKDLVNRQLEDIEKKEDSQ